MNKEENINDILELLKNMNSQPESNDSQDTDDSEALAQNDVVGDELQVLLKEKYMSDGEASVSEDGADNTEYKLDEEFFAEASAEEDTVEETVEEKIIEEEAIEEETIEEEIIEEETIEEETIEETIEEAIEEEAIEEEAIEEISEDAPQEYFSGDNGQLSLFEDSDGKEIGEDDSEKITDNERFDDSQITLDFGDNCEEDGVESANGEKSNIDASFLGLMLEIGDNVAIGKNVSNERDDIYDDSYEENDLSDFVAEEAYGFDGEEYSNEEQTDDILYSYSRDKRFTILRLIGCGLFTLLLAIFEALPKLSVNLGGVFDYNRFPAVYLLIGVQLLVFCGAFAWRELFGGLKKAFCLQSDIWSISALMTSSVVVYHMLLSMLSPSHLPKTFCTLAAIYILAGLFGEYLGVKREIRTFEVYSCDSVKYTFETEPIANSAAEKMYRGGVSSKINIFEPREVSFPRGYFSEVNRKSEPDVFINGIITPIILASAFFSIASMLTDVTLVESIEVFMISLGALCPMALFVSKTLPMSIVSSRLYERESAIASEASAKKYASCNVMIFRDSHLFKSSKASENGIVIYDKQQTTKVIEYLDALYGAIGGPMKELFSSAAINKYEPKLRRIARTGVEAVINGESVVLGDIDFQQRYGISFPEGENAKSGEGILCLSIAGKPAAKLCLKYATEPIFEMITERMEKNSIKCAIETYDPVINSAFVAASRKPGKEPINVVHKNVTDFYSEMPENVEGSTGLVACSSRLKLVECVIWCKRILTVRKTSIALHIVSWVATLVAIAVLLRLGYVENVDQYTIIALQVLLTQPVFLATILILPKKKYFAVRGIRKGSKKEKEKNREEK